MSLLQLELRFAPFGDVAGDLRVAEQPSLQVPDGVDQYAGPEHRAVLAHPPSLSLELSVCGRLIQRLHRPPRRPVGVGVEPGEVQADDLIGGVALDAFGARVPACHHAIRIQHDQSAIVDALDEHAELPLALQQRLLGRLTFGDVARGVDEADDLSGVVADRLQRGLGPEAAPILADSPALALEAPSREGGLQRPLGQAAAPILLVVEQRDVAADRGVRRVAGDPFRAGIPGRHPAARIDKKDRVVGDRVQQHLETPVLRDRLQRFQVDARARLG